MIILPESKNGLDYKPIVWPKTTNLFYKICLPISCCIDVRKILFQYEISFLDSLMPDFSNDIHRLTVVPRSHIT